MQGRPFVKDVYIRRCAVTRNPAAANYFKKNKNKNKNRETYICMTRALLFVRQFLSLAPSNFAITTLPEALGPRRLPLSESSYDILIFWDSHGYVTNQMFFPVYIFSIHLICKQAKDTRAEAIFIFLFLFYKL